MKKINSAAVLIVDDFQTNLDVAAGMLRKYEMRIDCVTSGQAAVDLIKAGEPVYAAVFMDRMMPVMDGIEAAQLIRGLNTEYARTLPIILLTAKDIDENEQVFLEKGFDAFLSKPIDILELDSIVNKWIFKKSPLAAGDLKSGNQAVPVNPAIEIPGVNMEIGLDLLSGDMELYVFALGSFVTYTPAAIDTLRNVTEENLPDYAVNVHSLKSGCATIGAALVSERAQKLEAMSKAGDLSGVLDQNEEFIRDAETLVSDIKNWLKSRG